MYVISEKSPILLQRSSTERICIKAKSGKPMSTLETQQLLVTLMLTSEPGSSISKFT